MTERSELFKRLFYQSCHRGCKETDMMLGNFAKEYLEKFNDSELIMYERFIEEDDWEIYNWLLGKVDFPERHKNKVTDLIIEYSLNRPKI